MDGVVAANTAQCIYCYEFEYYTGQLFSVIRNFVCLNCIFLKSSMTQNLAPSVSIVMLKNVSIIMLYCYQSHYLYLISNTI